jgi:hypothetical protein
LCDVTRPTKTANTEAVVIVSAAAAMLDHRSDRYVEYDASSHHGRTSPSSAGEVVA